MKPHAERGYAVVAHRNRIGRAEPLFVQGAGELRSHRMPCAKPLCARNRLRCCGFGSERPFRATSDGRFRPQISRLPWVRITTAYGEADRSAVQPMRGVGQLGTVSWRSGANTIVVVDAV